MWAAYNKERLGLDQIVEPDRGFIAYRIIPPVLHIEDVYTVPTERRSMVALSLSNKVISLAREQGCNTAQTRVWVGSSGAERAMRVNMACGFKLIAAENNCIIMQKDIGG